MSGKERERAQCFHFIFTIFSKVINILKVQTTEKRKWELTNNHSSRSTDRTNDFTPSAAHLINELKVFSGLATRNFAFGVFCVCVYNLFTCANGVSELENYHLFRYNRNVNMGHGSISTKATMTQQTNYIERHLYVHKFLCACVQCVKSNVCSFLKELSCDIERNFARTK